MIRILHAADLHLDSPFASLSADQAAQRRAEQRELLTELTELCSAHGCDLMLLAGDMFDSDNAYPDTIEALSRAFAACPAQIFIAPGNHDYAAAGSAYRTGSWPENVHIFTDSAIQSVTLPALSCRVWGAAFTSPRAGSLLEGFSAPEDGFLELMVLHGDATNAEGPYNTITRAQIAGSNLDYLALGHIHQQSGLLREGRTHYAWPGCPMGRGFDELGEKGVYLVELEAGECRGRFLPLSGRRYEILTVTAGEDPLAAALAALPADAERHICRILFTGEAQPLDVQALRRALAPRCFALSIQDRTTAPVDLWAGCAEDTLRGLFLRTLKAQYDQADDAAQRQTIADAARLGLAAMDGREVPEL